MPFAALSGMLALTTARSGSLGMAYNKNANSLMGQVANAASGKANANLGTETEMNMKSGQIQMAANDAMHDRARKEIDKDIQRTFGRFDATV